METTAYAPDALTNLRDLFVRPFESEDDLVCGGVAAAHELDTPRSVTDRVDLPAIHPASPRKLAAV